MDTASYLTFGSCIQCGAWYGEAHWPECGVAPTVPHSGWLTRTGGREAAAAECRRRGWSAVFILTEGFRPCRPGEPGAMPDLGRYGYWLEHEAEDLVGADA